MRLFFISEIPCFLTENGTYLGTVNKNLKYAEVDENSLISFKDLNGEYNEVNATIYNNSQVKYYEVEDYKIIVPLFKKKRNLPFKVIYQNDYKIYGEVFKLTVYLDGSIKYSIDGAFFDTQELPFYPDKIEIKMHENHVIALFFGKSTAVFIYELTNNNAEIVYKNITDSFTIENTLKTQKKYNLIVPTDILEEWSFSNPFSLLSRKTEFLTDINAIPPSIKNCLFFQLLTIRANVSSFLSTSMIDRTEDLYSFIGNPVFVIPSPNNSYETLIITNEKASVYTVETENQLIVNIKEND